MDKALRAPVILMESFAFVVVAGKSPRLIISWAGSPIAALVPCPITVFPAGMSLPLQGDGIMDVAPDIVVVC